MGTEIVRYDIYGPDVLIANKMESKGQKGRIHISAETRDLLEDHFPSEFVFQYNGNFDFPSIERRT